MKTFGEVLDALNARTGLSDRKLGVRLGAGEGAVTAWRTGRSYPRPAKLDEIARMVNVDPVQLRAMIEAEKAKDPAQRATWQRIAASFAKAALLAFVTLGGGATLHNGDYVNSASAASALSDYTLQRIRRFIRWLMLAAALPLAACTVDPYWVKVDDFTPTSVRVEVVDDLGYTGRDGIEGTAFRDHASGECLITLKRGADRERVMAHEMKHCDGWDHPSYHVSLDGFIPPLPR